MEEKLDFANVPSRYSLCLNRQCPNAATCLRQIAEVSAPDDVECWTIISPKRLASLTGDCPYYRSNKKTRYAMGFINILDSLPYKQMQEVSKYLISHFGQSTYYRARKGTRPLLPTEQQFVLEKDAKQTVLKNSMPTMRTTTGSNSFFHRDEKGFSP